MLPQVMQRMSLNAGLVQADTMPVPGTGVAEVELEAFHRYYRKCFGVEVATPPVTPDVTPEMNHLELMRALGLKDLRHFRQQNQQAAGAAVHHSRAHSGGQECRWHAAPRRRRA